jgi:hypothetical protein
MGNGHQWVARLRAINCSGVACGWHDLLATERATSRQRWWWWAGGTRSTIVSTWPAPRLLHQLSAAVVSTQADADSPAQAQQCRKDLPACSGGRARGVGPLLSFAIHAAVPSHRLAVGPGSAPSAECRASTTNYYL